MIREAWLWVPPSEALAILGRMEVVVVVALMPQIMNAFYGLSSVGRLYERREIRQRPTKLLDDGRLAATVGEECANHAGPTYSSCGSFHGTECGPWNDAANSARFDLGRADLLHDGGKNLKRILPLAAIEIFVWAALILCIVIIGRIVFEISFGTATLSRENRHSNCSTCHI